MPKEVSASGVITGLDREISDPLRQKLHAWGMSTARAATTAYRIMPMELVRAAAKEIVARGARIQLSVKQLRCELALMPESTLLRDGASVPEDLAIRKDSRWLGRALLTLDIRATNASSRLRLYGRYNRWYDFIRIS